MSLICVESFDGVDTTSIQQKGWNNPGSGSPTISSAQARTGANSLLLDGTTDALLRGVAVAEEHATFIIGFALRLASLSSEIGICEFRSDSGATSHLSMTVATTGAILVRRGTSTGTQIAASAGGAISINTWYYVEMKALLSDTVGTVQVRVDGADAIPATGSLDTKNGGTKAVFDSVTLGCGNNITNNAHYYDDMYLCNGAGATNNNFIGDSRVRLMLPSGNGNTSQLLGSDANSVDNYLLIDEVPPSTTDFVGSGVDNQKDTYVFQDLPDATGTVVGVQISSYALKTDAGARSLAHVIRHGGADYDSADLTLPTPNPTFVTTLQEVNPGTGVAWLRSEVNAAEFGVKARP